MDKIEFVNLLRKKNIELTDQMINQFDMYFNLIVKYNKVMDLTAITMAKEQNVSIVVFNQHNTDSLVNAVCAKGKFTIIKK